MRSRRRLELELGALAERERATREQLHELAQQVRGLELDSPVASLVPGPAWLERMWALDLWLEHADPSDTLVSVVLPTHDRPELVLDAIASVQAQTHPAWELIVVGDGVGEAVDAVLAGLSDPRIRVLRTEGVGSPEARNRGLAEARGAVIAYLDDDNVMLPGWLRAVAWAFDRFEQVDVLYGARVVEEFGAGEELPRIALTPFDRARLEQANYVDANVIAHRAGLADAGWDPDLVGLADWDLIQRLTEHGPPLVLPACAVLYRTSAPGRQSGSARQAVSHEMMRAREALREAPRPSAPRG